MTLDALLGQLARLGLTLTEEGGRLRVRGPAGAVDEEVRRALVEHKSVLIAALRGARAAVGTAPVPAIPGVSAGQERLWLLDRLAGQEGLCNVSMGLRMTGPLDAASLRRAIEEVVRRHDILRTTFPSKDGRPDPQVRAEGPAPLTVIDLRGFAEAMRAPEVERLSGLEAARPFALEVGPLLRTALLVLGEQEHLLLVAAHHLVCDGWSMGIFLRELTTLYDAFAAGRASPLPPPTAQFSDFVRREHRHVTDADHAAAVARWQARLAGSQDLDLCDDHPRAKVASHRGRTARFTVPPADVAAIEAIARSAGTTLYGALLAGYAVFLRRHARSGDVAANFNIGTMVAVREDRQLRDVMGFMVDTRPVRCDLHDDPSFVRFAARLHPVVRAVLADHAPAFDRIGRDLAPRADPLFRATFVFENTPIPARSGPGGRWEVILASPDGATPGTAKFDVGLSMMRGRAGLDGAFEVSVDGFDEATIARFPGRFTRLLHAIALHPDVPVSRLALVPDDELALQVAWWDRSHRPIDAMGAPRTIPALITARSGRTPEAAALVFEGTTLDYRTLEARSDALARHLVARGVGRGVVVGVYTERSLEMVVGVLAVLKAGGAYVPIDPHFPRDRVAWMLEDARVPVVLTQVHLAADLERIGREGIGREGLEGGGPRGVRFTVIALDGPLVGDGRAADGPALPALQPDDLAYVIYTSGSTGRPKGVEITHASVVNLLESLGRTPGLGADDTVVAVTSLSFDTAVADLYWPLSCGARVVVASREDTTDGHRLAALLTRTRATLLQATPATWRLLLDAGWDNPHRLRILSTGEALPPALAAELLPRTDALWNLYGPTETTVWSSLGRVTSAMPPILLGEPVANTRLYVLDAHDHPVPIGVPGALCIGGAGLARGYLGRPDLTAERFVADPMVPGGRMYRTGDLARYRADGGLEYLGRADHQVKIRGYRIELGEIEAVLAGHPAVRAAVVVARDLSTRPRLVAYAVLRPGRDQGTAALRAHLEAALPAYMVPDTIVLLDALPIGPTGKLDRSALPGPPDAADAPVVTPPRTPDEVAIAALWAELLSLPVAGIGAHDTFFALGGHSLLATRLVSRIRDRFGAELSVRELFETPTVAGLAARVTGATAVALPRVPALRPAPRPDPLPLSFAQQRLWFLDQLDPGGAAYTMPAALRLVGPLDVDGLRRVFEAIVDRHEILRTRLVARGGAPAQIIDPVAPRPLAVVDLSASPHPEEEVLRRATVEAATPFDLARGPLFRTTLLRLADQHHVLLVTLHHAVADAWSVAVLVREIAALAEAFAQGRPSPLPALPIQYADFALWQRERLTGAYLDAQLGWWKQQLAGVPVLELPTDRPRPPLQTHAGDRVSLVLSPELSAALQSLARDHDATLFMVLLSGFFLLLSRWSGQTDFCVGAPAAGRDVLELEPLIGFLVNTLVLRADLGAHADGRAPSFRELLARVRSATLDAQAHAEVPFDLLVDALHLKRDRSRHPLVQVTFTFQSVGAADPALPGLTIEPITVETHIAKQDLAFDLGERDGTIHGEVEYNTDLYDRATIERMVGHFLRTLEGAITRPALSIWKLPLLTDAELAQHLEWRQGPPALTDVPRVHHAIEAQVRRSPDAVAVGMGVERLTYGALNQQANRLAHHLRTLGVGPGVPVALCLPRSPQLIVGLLAIFKSGGVYVPLDPGYPLERLAFVLNDAAVAVIVTEDALADTLPVQHRQLVCLDADAEVLATRDDTDPDRLGTDDDTAYVIYTSGSTGAPKGVEVPHGSIAAHTAEIVRAYGLTPSDRVLQLAATSFDVSLEQILPTLVAGATLVIRGPEHWSTSEFHRQVAANGVTVADLSPAYWRELAREWMEQPGLAQGCPLRLLTVGGDALPVDGLGMWLRGPLREVALINAYGPTEATVTATTFRIDPARAAPVTLPIGRPMPGRTATVLDTHQNLVPVGVRGELFLGGDRLARGYLGRPELTAERFVGDPFDPRPGARMYRTGDAARVLPDGNLAYLGRIDRQVKIRGFRIEPGEIEAALVAHPAVLSAAVGTHEALPGDRRLVAWIVPRDPAEWSDTAARTFLGARLPEYMVPSLWVTLSALPVRADGSVDRAALPAPGVAERLADDPPQTPTEIKVARLWAEVLGAPCVNRHDDFFALGGHSLLATQVMSRVLESLGRDLPLSALFDASTLAGFAARVDAQPPGGGSGRLTTVIRSGQVPLSFAQERLWFLDALSGRDTTYYNMATALRLLGPLDAPALERSLREIVARHEVLRTTFAPVGDAPVQRISSEVELTMPVVDLQPLEAGAREDEIRCLAAQEEVRPFDLSTGPVLRVTLLRCGSADHTLLVTMHHIASDGWSAAVFGRELGALYAAFTQHRPSPLAPLPIQYADFALWQRAPERADAIAVQLRYWTERLRGALPIRLPIDHPRPPAPTHRGATERRSLSPSLTRGLHGIGQARGTTLFMTLLAAFQALLHRYSGQEDIVIGTDVANRNRAETEGLIGFFVNQIVLRTDLSGDPTFVDLLGRVRNVTLEAYANQDVPFQSVVRELRASRDRSRAPLFQAKLVLQNTPPVGVSLGALTLTPMVSDRALANFDLTLTVSQEGGSDGSDDRTLLLEFEYATDLFDRVTIVQLARSYETVLAAVVADDTQRIGDIRTVADAGADAVLVDDFAAGELDAHDLHNLEMALGRLFEET